mgnify:CR=1 FL=1
MGVGSNEAPYLLSIFAKYPLSTFIKKASVDNSVDSRETIAILRVVEPDGKIVEIPLLKGSSFQYLPLWS